MKPTSLDIAVLLEKAIILNGIIANGTKAEKQMATKEFLAIKPFIHCSMSTIQQTTEGTPFLLWK